MARKVDIITALLADSRELEESGRSIQGERELLVTEEDIDAFVERYHGWFGRAVAVLPAELAERFRGEYNGGVFSPKIKNFLRAPGEVNIIRRSAEGGPESGDLTLLPYWQHPYDTTFHGPLLNQRQILVEARQALLGTGHGEAIELVERMCRGFGEFLYPLAHRQRERTPFVPEDDYDVQDVLHGLLRVFFDDIRPEDFAPERGGARSRVDFVLKPEHIVVEAKMTRAGLGAAQIGEELIVDIERYRSHPDCDAIVALVYDPEKRIANRRTLETDLSGERDGLIVRVIVVQ